jgi:putative transposase
MRSRSEHTSPNRVVSSTSNSTGAKKQLDGAVEATHQLSELGPPCLSVRRQGALLGLSRARLPDEPGPESAEHLRVRRLLDEPSTRTPDDGMRRLTAWLRTQGYPGNHQRVQRRLRLMGLEAISQKPPPGPLVGAPQVSPYRLRGGTMARVKQGWSTEMTYIRRRQGCVYVVAILDWVSRDVVAWEVSVTRDSHVCLRALERARVHAQPESFHADQGAPFTSLALTARLKARGIHTRMEGRGRALENIVVER